MKKSKLHYFFGGYLTVCAEGPFAERLINICLHRGMGIFDIKRCGSNKIIFNIEMKSFFEIRIPARRTRSHIRIVKRKGLPFIVKKYKKRKYALVGVLLIAVMFWYTSNHIMGITVFGNSRIASETIVYALDECGVKLGSKTSEIKPDILRNKLMIRLPELAWVGINANGSRIYIEIVERIENEKGIDKEAPVCDLIASKDGEIEKIEVREGQTICKVGSGVRKGDVLVSGIVDSTVSGYDYVRARGEIYAKTRYVEKRSYPLVYEEETYTGKKRKRYSLTIMDKTLPIYVLNKIPYERYKVSEKVSEYKLPIDIFPSIFVTKKEYSEIKGEKKTVKPSEIKEELGSKFLKEQKEKLPDTVEVIEENVSYTLNEKNEAEITVELVCRENIAEEFVIETNE